MKKIQIVLLGLFIGIYTLSAQTYTSSPFASRLPICQTTQTALPSKEYREYNNYNYNSSRQILPHTPLSTSPEEKTQCSFSSTSCYRFVGQNTCRNIISISAFNQLTMSDVGNTVLPSLRKGATPPPPPPDIDEGNEGDMLPLSDAQGLLLFFLLIYMVRVYVLRQRKPHDISPTK